MSELLSSEIEIGKRMFRIQKIPARRASLLLNRILRLLAPAAAQVTGALSAQFRIMDASVGALAPAFTQFFSTFTEEEQTKLFDDMFQNVRWKSDRGEWLELQGPLVDECFTGHVSDMFRLLIECIKFQFGDFKDAFTAALNAYGTKTAVSSPKTIPMQ
jgi:hypothetical protein